MENAPLGHLDREAGTAWVQQPFTALVLSTELTIRVPAPQTPLPAVRRPRRFASPMPSEQRRLGAGLVDVPVVAGLDPLDAVLSDPVIGESSRFCRSCGKPVGRGRDGQPAQTDGFCAQCGRRFSFSPFLRRGDVVGDRYEVVGVLAHGGVSWIYLTQDLDADRRWVVLKGLIDTADPNAIVAATAEARVLTEVRHPNIVRIYDLVPETDPRAGNSFGYLAMEYVSGLTLGQLHRDTRYARDHASLPLGQVIAYGLDILAALGYLHRKGLLYGDLKPDNVIQSGERLKLIDFGAVRSMDDRTSPIYYTPAYGAPELRQQGPSVATDLYSVGRTLFQLGHGSAHEGFDSYQRLLNRATDPDPDRRFRSAEEMAEQLTGVLREVVAMESGTPRPGPSARFEPLAGTFGTVVTHHGGYVVLATDPSEIIAALPSPLPDAGESEGWHAAWQRGRDALAEGLPADARYWFNEVYAALPGELAPKLALAAAAELSGMDDEAAKYYGSVWATDHHCHSAAFGLARIRQSRDDRAGVEAVLRSVPGFGPPAAAAPDQPRRVRRSRWHIFARGLANSLIPVPEPRRYAQHRSGQDRIDARLREAYSTLGPPVPAGKDRDR
ncbi:MAG TPA: serine/threonine protein kinase [Pseudonocardiaceae bacterium]|nr:serine/threonine protein kinase [Pseudonocardiaceae bacterium]